MVWHADRRIFKNHLASAAWLGSDTKRLQCLPVCSEWWCVVALGAAGPSFNTSTNCWDFVCFGKKQSEAKPNPKVCKGSVLREIDGVC